jgi:uncharacterized oligopeptide transporter (OPT) family protein
VYAGLKIGFTTDGSLVAAVLAVALGRTWTGLLGGSFSPRETNLVQTAASAGAFCAVAGLTNAVPAMHLDGVRPDPWWLVPWVLCLAGLGVCVAAPLRRRVIEVDRLRFPSGTACAEAIRALHAERGEARRGASALGLSAAVAGAWTWIRDAGLGAWGRPLPAFTPLPGAIGGLSGTQLTLGIAWNPLLAAVGALVGLRVALSLLIGALCGTVAGGVALTDGGWVAPSGFGAIRAWTVWPAVGLIAAGGLGALAASAVRTRRARRAGRAAPDAGDGAEPMPAVPEADETPRRWWIAGLIGCGAGAALTARLAFDVPVWQTLVAVVLAVGISVVAVRAVGETDISPSNNLAKVTQFLFGGLAPGQTVPNVAAAGVAAGCAMEASEVMTDLKAGFLLGNRPRDQFVAQAVGVVVAAGAAVGAYLLLVAAVPFGEDGLPAPTAVAWRTLAHGLAGGQGLPEWAAVAAWTAAGVGLLLGAAGARIGRVPLPSPVAVGLGAILPASYSVTVCVGAFAAAAVARWAPDFWERRRYIVPSGLIVGESLAGLAVAVRMVVG